MWKTPVCSKGLLFCGALLPSLVVPPGNGLTLHSCATRMLTCGVAELGARLPVGMAVAVAAWDVPGSGEGGSLPYHS